MHFLVWALSQVHNHFPTQFFFIKSYIITVKKMLCFGQHLKEEERNDFQFHNALCEKRGLYFSNSIACQGEPQMKSAFSSTTIKI